MLIRYVNHAPQVMPLEQFSLFYRFVFYISREPKKKHLKVDPLTCPNQGQGNYTMLCYTY